MRAKPHSDTLLNMDPSGRFVPWIVALMVYLATISLIVAFSVSSLINRWESGLSETLTIEIPSHSIVKPGLEESTSQVKSNVIQTLLKTPGIER